MILLTLCKMGEANESEITKTGVNKKRIIIIVVIAAVAVVAAM